MNPAPSVPANVWKLLSGCERLDAAARVANVPSVKPTFAALCEHPAFTALGRHHRAPVVQRPGRLPLTGLLLSQCLAQLHQRTVAPEGIDTLFHAQLPPCQ